MKDGKDLRNMDIYLRTRDLACVQCKRLRSSRKVTRETRVSMGGCIEETCKQEYVKENESLGRM